jgi:hypothetical protein
MDGWSKKIVNITKLSKCLENRRKWIGLALQAPPITVIYWNWWRPIRGGDGDDFRVDASSIGSWMSTEYMEPVLQWLNRLVSHHTLVSIERRFWWGRERYGVASQHHHHRRH